MYEYILDAICELALQGEQYIRNPVICDEYRSKIRQSQNVEGCIVAIVQVMGNKEFIDTTSKKSYNGLVSICTVCKFIHNFFVFFFVKTPWCERFPREDLERGFVRKVLQPLFPKFKLEIPYDVITVEQILEFLERYEKEQINYIRQLIDHFNYFVELVYETISACKDCYLVATPKTKRIDSTTLSRNPLRGFL